MTSAHQPLRFHNLELSNRTIRASRAFADEATTFAWELRFARQGVGAIISSCIHPGSPSLSTDAIQRWHEHIGRIHAYGCKYILRIGQPNSMPDAVTEADLRHLAWSYGEAALRVRESGADGVEIDLSGHSLAAQYLGPGLGERPAGYQGSIESRCRLALELVGAVRAAFDAEPFHVQVRLAASSPLGLMASGTLHLATRLEKLGVDAIHLVIEGDRPAEHTTITRFVRQATTIPILRNGLFQAPETIRSALDDGSCDAVTMTRPLDRPDHAAGPVTQRAA